MTASRRYLWMLLPAFAAVLSLAFPTGTLVAQEAEGTVEAADAEAETEPEADVEPDAAARADAEPGALVAYPAEPAIAIPEDPEVRAAVEAATAWLEFVDAGDFQEAWAAGASSLQVGISPAALKASIKDGRPSFTRPIVHTVIGFQLVKNPANAAPGDYVIVRCRTRGEEGRTVLENVVLKREGQEWRVAGYFTSREEAG